MRILRPGNRIITIGGSTRVISPRGGAAIPWYLSGGVSAANCIAAYQPIGAASYAASKVNLANPGTYNASDGAAYPDWNTATGWQFVLGDSEYLDSNVPGLVPYQSGSYIVRFSNGDTGNNAACLLGTGYVSGLVQLQPKYYNEGVRYQSGTAASNNTPYLTGGVLCIAGIGCYRNGSSEATLDASLLGSNSTTITIGCGRSTAGAAAYFKTAYIQALSIYDTVLTSDQVSAITTAMNAL